MLTEKDWQDAADALKVEVAAIKAVAAIEAPSSGFLPSGEPRVLFERHKFHRLTGGKFDASHPRVSNAKPGGYGPESIQHAKLAEAVALDRDAALKSASWGRFQILGSNWKEAGFQSLQEFINAMYKGEDSQLRAFVQFVRHNPRMLLALRKLDFVAFAERYNGPNQAKHDYSGRLKSAYEGFA